MPTLTSAYPRCIPPFSCFTDIVVVNRLLVKQLWYQTKTKIKPLFSSGAARPSPGPITKLPQELVEEIISYFIDYIRTLLACSLTCRSWYIATIRHLHYSLTTDEDSLNTGDKKHWWPTPLKNMYEFDLLPLVKRFQIRMWRRGLWFTPDRLDEHNLCYFSALKNLQELGIDDLDVSGFMPDLQRCFGHLSPTLRFLALRQPNGSSRQIVYFIGLFPNLQDLKLHSSTPIDINETLADKTPVPLSSPPLRGRLTLTFFTREQIVKDMITLFGGLRFHHMDLFGVRCLPLLLKRCAKTLDTLRLYPTDPYGKFFSFWGRGGGLIGVICSGKNEFRFVAKQGPSNTGDLGGINRQRGGCSTWIPENCPLLCHISWDARCHNHLSLPRLWCTCTLRRLHGPRLFAPSP